MSMKKAWMIDDDNYTEEAWLVLETLQNVVKESDVAEDTGVDNDLIQAWLNDPAFMEEEKSVKSG